jgi:hypothetical protein
MMRRSSSRHPSLQAFLPGTVRALGLPLLFASLQFACGSSQPTAQTADESQETQSAPPAAAPTPAPAAEEPPAAASADAPSEPASPDEPDPDNRQRQVLYRTTPAGLAVSVEGVQFLATASPIKLKNGGFGIKLKVTAEAKDENMHTLMSPQNGPLAVAGKIKRSKSGEEVPFGDERGNEDEQFIAPGSPLEIERDWPPENGPYAWWGDEIELQVGLWGLANAGDRRRPVRKLFLVKMVATAKGTPVVLAPRM